MERLKTCSKCRKSLPLAAFSVKRSEKDGLRSSCRQCALADWNLWASKNREHLKGAWTARNKTRDKSKERQRRKDKSAVVTAQRLAKKALEPTDRKTCTKCGIVLALNFFYKSKAGKLGHQSWCKKCRKPIVQKWIDNNKPHINQLRRFDRESNPEKYLAYSRNKTDEQRTKLRAQKKDWDKRNSEHVKQQRAIYNESHREERRARSLKIYYADLETNRAKARLRRNENRDERNAKKREWSMHASQTLSDAYIRGALTNDTAIQANNIPQSLIELKRAQLLIARELRSKKK